MRIEVPDPSCCPACGSDDIVGDNVHIDGTVAHQEVYCSECNHMWTDSYLLLDRSAPRVG